MTSTICDSSAVDQYLLELSNREIERTRRLKIENTRRETPLQILRIIGIGFAIALVLWALGSAFKNANSFHKISEILGSSQNNYQEHYSSSKDIRETTDQGSSLDQLIDVDALLDSSSIEISPEPGTSIFENPSIIEEYPEGINEHEIVRNYVIFDDVEFDGQVITSVMTGRNYPDVDSEVDHSWCYVTNNTSSSGSVKLNLIGIRNGERTDYLIDEAEAIRFGASLEEIKSAKEQCTI
tara:strand:- start:745 stop:1461 length:717 start_codon:yes stop_codon:yes gene_type:complete